MEGSPFDVIESSARNAELDALTVRYGGQMKSNAYNSDADLSMIQGKNARENSYYKAGATFLGGAMSAAGQIPKSEGKSKLSLSGTS